MFWIKACPRCQGDLFLDRDANNRDVVCLQCGYRRGSNENKESSMLMDTNQRQQVHAQLLEVKQ